MPMQGPRPASDVSTTKSVGEFGIELPFIPIKHQSKRFKLNHTLGELPSAATDLPKARWMGRRGRPVGAWGLSVASPDCLNPGQGAAQPLAKRSGYSYSYRLAGARDSWIDC